MPKVTNCLCCSSRWPRQAAGAFPVRPLTAFVPVLWHSRLHWRACLVKSSFSAASLLPGCHGHVAHFVALTGKTAFIALSLSAASGSVCGRPMRSAGCNGSASSLQLFSGNPGIPFRCNSARSLTLPRFCALNLSTTSDSRRSNELAVTGLSCGPNRYRSFLPIRAGG